METHGVPGDPGERQGPDPTPAEAAAALRLAEEAAASLAEVKTPLWYFVALGALIAPLAPITRALPDPPAGVAVLVGVVVVWVAALAGLMSLVVRQMGVLAWLDERQARPLAVIMLVLLAVYAVVQLTFAPDWWPAASTGVAGAGIVAFGLYHRRQHPAGAS